MKNYLKELQDRFNKKEKLDFLFFWGHQVPASGVMEKSCFSQWYPASFEESGVRYSNTEQYMMSKKAELFGDKETGKKILDAHTPKEIKALGRLVKNFDAKIWDDHKYEIVRKGNFLKFSQNESMRDFLIQTKKKIIVEASPYDRIWGIGMMATDKHSANPNLWNGENLLGFALMEVRELLQQ